MNKSAGTPADYDRQRFIDGVKDGVVKFHWDGGGEAVVKGIGVEDARWAGRLLSLLSPEQIASAFRAGGFDANEVATYVQALRRRIDSLLDLPLK
jgi:hypothetical protein